MTTADLRNSLLPNARRLVIKLGTQLLTSTDPKTPGIDPAFVRRMAGQVASLRGMGKEVTIVSSGAIGAGCAELGLKSRPKDIADQQAVAAVGQRRLMDRWHDAFEKHSLHVGQILLTRGDFEDRVRFLNTRNCIARLHEMNCVPIINENDTVAVDELRFGDNDLLAALVCNAVDADALVILSVVDGLLDPEGKRVPFVKDVRDVFDLDRKDKSTLGSGGMTTKLQAARLATDAGQVALIANGREPDLLTRLFDRSPADAGTLFAPASRRLDSRERWIGLTKRPSGTITIDPGAIEAIRSRGKSLLPSGITELTGLFDRGDVVLIRDAQGKEVARGLTNYSSDELRQIMGKKSAQFGKLLEGASYDEAVHRDNLVVMRS